MLSAHLFGQNEPQYVYQRNVWNNVPRGNGFMNAKFHPAMKAVKTNDLEQFKAAIAADRSLATARSTRSHPTLLQCVVLDGKDKPHNAEMAQILDRKSVV